MKMTGDNLSQTTLSEQQTRWKSPPGFMVFSLAVGIPILVVLLCLFSCLGILWLNDEISYFTVQKELDAQCGAGFDARAGHLFYDPYFEWVDADLDISCSKVTGDLTCGCSGEGVS
jgi:hypothetical protein